MNVLIVISHPDTGSFTHALAARFADGARAAGHGVEIADLHQEGFDPRWTMSDAAQFDDAPPPADIRDQQERIARCDAICLAFPLYWFAMPAMLKGWIDRVFTWGWAYDQVDDPTRSLLKQRPTVLLVPAAANPENWKEDGFEAAMASLWGQGTLGYFGMGAPRICIMGGSEGSPARRAHHLETAFEAGKGINGDLS